MPRPKSPPLPRSAGKVLPCFLAMAVPGLLFPSPDGLFAQTATRIEADPPSLVMERGTTAELRIRLADAGGRTVEEPVRVVAPRQGLALSGETVTARRVGEYEIVVTTVRPGPGGQPLQLIIPVVVVWPPVVRIEVESPGPLYKGARVKFRATALHGDGTVRPRAEFVWTTSHPARAEVDAFGHVTGKARGPVRVEAAFEGVTGGLSPGVRDFPGASLVLEGGAQTVRTGDVQIFSAVVRDAAGNPIPDAPVEWSHSYVPAPGVMAPPARWKSSGRGGKSGFIAPTSGSSRVWTAGTMRW